MRVKQMKNKELTDWISETKKCYRVLKKMPIEDLKTLAKMGGLDLDHYKTKTILAKGMMVRLSNGMLPTEMSKWK
jgi:hypothetical protein